MLSQRRVSHMDCEDVDTVGNSGISLSMGNDDEGALMSAAGLEDFGAHFSGSLCQLDTSPYATLCPCWSAQWKEAYFVVAGSFFFLFKSYRETHPQTSPIPIKAIRTNYLGGGVFEISTIREKLTLKAKSDSECLDWIRAISTRRLVVIKESMGHAKPSTTTVKIDTAANKLYMNYLGASDNDTSEHTPLLG
jgi:hypothetical protein